MKTAVKCPGCGYENPLYVVVCQNCSAFLRDKVVNIDLWQTVSFLVENPAKAFRNIIFAEHKNFISFIIILCAVKLLINSRFISVVSIGEFSSTTSLLVSYGIVLISWTIILLLYSLIAKSIINSTGIKNRFKDILTLVVYSHTPFIFGLIFLFPLDLVIYGDYIFSSNPSPFVIKEIAAYILFGVECLLILWSIFLLGVAFYSQIGNVIYSALFSILYFSILSALLFIASLYIFLL